MTIGSLIIYAIGYYGGEKVVNRFGHILGTNVGEIEKTARKIEKSRRIWITIAILRIIFVVPTSLVSITSGFMRLNWKKFAVSTFIGALPRIFILSLIGWKLGSAFTSIGESLKLAESTLFAVIILGMVFAVAFFIYKKHGKKTVGKSKNRKNR